MRRIKRLLMVLLAATMLATMAASPAMAEGGGGWVPPVPNGNTPDPNEVTPPIGDPGAIRNDCIRIDFFPGYGPSYVLELAYDIVIMSDGTGNFVYYSPKPGDRLFGPGGPLKWVIKCGFGGFGNYVKPPVIVVPKPPIKVPPTKPGNGDKPVRKLEFTIDGCQPKSIATVVVDGGPTQDFTVPASGVLVAYVVLPPNAPDPVRFTVSCNGYTTTVPVDERTIDIIVGAGGIPEADGAVAPGVAAPGASGGSGSGPAVESINPLIVEGLASEMVTAESLPTAPVAIAVNADAIAAAAATDGAKSITIAGQPDRSFALDELGLINPSTAKAAVAVVSGPDGVAQYVAGTAPSIGQITGTANGLATSANDSLPLARIGLGALAGLGLAAFGLRRRSGRNRAVDTLAA